MIQRCSNPKSEYYERYGGRGIKVCQEWESFEQFLADMGEASPELTIERRRNNLGYCKSNCYWATRLDQAQNTSHPKVEFAGESKTVPEWARELGITKHALHSRLRRGWPLERALSGAC